MAKSLTDVLADGLTAALVELIAIGKGADVLKAIGNLERGAVISGEADAILESAAHVCRENERPSIADLLKDIETRFEQPENIRDYLLDQLGKGHATPDPGRICAEFAAQINQRFQQEQIAILATDLAAEARNGQAVCSDLRRLIDELEATAE